MGNAVFRVVHAGPFITVQDQGRMHLMRYGIPQSGPMDRKSFAIANAALGNDMNTPTLEISMGGLTLECVEGSVTLAIVGGGFMVQLGDEKFGSWQCVTIQQGQRLAIKPGPWGCWTYLAFAGHLQAENWFGSLATHSQSGFGGKKLVSGDEIIIQSAEIREDRVGDIPCPVWARARHEVRVVLGPQDRFFDEAALHALLHQRFQLTDAYDRMGVRLRGPRLIPKEALSIPSEAILRGSIQVAGDGTATVLLADHQTTGGYPKIATIMTDDTDGFTQLRPHDGIRFKPILSHDAVALTRRRTASVMTYLAALERRLNP